MKAVSHSSRQALPAGDDLVVNAWNCDGRGCERIRQGTKQHPGEPSLFGNCLKLWETERVRERLQFAVASFRSLSI